MASIGYVILSISYVALGWAGYGLLNLNAKRDFLSKTGSTFLSMLSFVFNILGSIYCIRGLFGF